jgi:hypothetical protein
MKSTLKSRPATHAHTAATHSAVRHKPSHGARSEQVAQGGGLTAGIASAPRVALQRKQLHAAFGHAIQRQDGPEGEELLQGKFSTLQRQGPEEEELLQGKFGPVQRQPGPEEEELLQGKFDAVQRQGPEEEELQMKQRVRTATPAQIEAYPAPRKNNTGLPDNLKSGIESLSGMSMDNVKVHYNSGKPAQLNALAYAQGSDIHVAPGQERYLPHEAWHVAQQAQGRVRPTIQVKDGVPVNDDKGLEQEADVMGQRALQTKYDRSEGGGSVAQAKCAACESEEVAQSMSRSAVGRGSRDVPQRMAYSGPVVQRACYVWSGTGCGGTRRGPVTSLHNAKNKGNKSWSPNADGDPCHGKRTMKGHC